MKKSTVTFTSVYGNHRVKIGGVMRRFENNTLIADEDLAREIRKHPEFGVTIHELNAADAAAAVATAGSSSEKPPTPAEQKAAEKAAKDAEKAAKAKSK